jgi:hypothetical protein
MPRTILGDIASWHRLYLAAKPSHVGVYVDALACPLHHPMACGCQTRGHGFLSGATLSHHAAVSGAAIPGVGRLGSCVTEFLHGVNRFYQGMLILCQSHHGIYACIPGRATASGSDGMDSST